ncbi:MAG: hypothetical protein EHM58_06670 [Ignavibacteriae bacterium]|nr:MAG: hypothetical protein EHM58_06670 [Ignavibacteriota bacterium]
MGKIRQQNIVAIVGELKYYFKEYHTEAGASVTPGVTKQELGNELISAPLSKLSLRSPALRGWRGAGGEVFKQKSAQNTP